ncbi:hypothetical protein SEA_BAXTERFOX_27 [Gordonia phage BaxterFox]|uniref:LtfC/p132/Gp6 beta-sandwich domain-containing protein n=2 Tax=Nymbaxtervirinae TaxID=2169601 RepID=A0A142KCK4_9CAUD|nr:hypothetical protein SEA_BAXTERFOX_27 [Gordonia phage BaxterFox]AMS03837.1 hypothetical protein SEA_BAXTERFOX_27 [Gordonia phage BaxterFox]
MMNTSRSWNPEIPWRGLTIYKGQDIDIAFRLRLAQRDDDGRIIARVLWTPPDGTTAYFEAYGKGHAPIQIPCNLDGSQVSTHIERTVLDTIDNGDEFWLWIKTPDTTNGNPKPMTRGPVTRVDPPSA